MMKAKFEPYLKKYALLSFSSLLLRIYGGFYRLYLLRRFGAEPFGLMGMIFPFYRLLSLLITLGLPTALVRLIAIEKAKNNGGWIRQTTKQVSTIVTLTSFLIALPLFLFAKPIGSFLYNDPRTATILRYFALALSLNSLCLVYRGYFHGLDRTTPLALADLIETFGETVFIIFFLFTTKSSRFTVEWCTRILAQGYLLGEITCLSALFIYDRMWVRPQLLSTAAKPFPGRQITALLRSSFPLMAQQLIMALARIAESILLPKLLSKGGMNPSQIANALGEYWEMSMPLVSYPLILFAPISTLILPATARATVKKTLPAYFRKIWWLLGSAFLYGVSVSFLILQFSKPLSLLLYKTTAAIRYLPFLLPALPFMVMNNLLIPVAEGLGKQNFLLRVTFILIFIKNGVMAAFVPLPAFGLAGIAWGVTISQALLFCLLLKETLFSAAPNMKWFFLFHSKFSPLRELHNYLKQLFTNNI